MVRGKSRALTASPRDVARPKGIPNLHITHAHTDMPGFRQAPMQARSYRIIIILIITTLL